MTYIVLRGLWYDVILNAHAPTEGKSDHTEECFYEELQQVFKQFPT